MSARAWLRAEWHWLLACFGLHVIGSEPDLDSRRLDWLESRQTRVIESRSYDDPYGEHVANAWSVEGPFFSVRDAIDAHMAGQVDHVTQS